MKKKLQLLSISCLAMLMAAVFIFADKNGMVATKVSGESIIKSAFNNLAGGSDNVFVINEALQTKFGAFSASTSIQGNTVTPENSSVSVNSNKTTIIVGDVVVTDSMHIPEPARVQFESGRDFVFNKSEGISFRWNSDRENSYPVIVVLQHISDTDEQLITKDFRFSDTDQVVRLSAEDIASFPSGGKVNMYIGRGNYQLSGKGSLSGISITTVAGMTLR